MDKDPKRFYTVKEVAKITGICLSNVYEGLRNGEIPVGVKVGRRWLIPKVRFDEWWGDHGQIRPQTADGYLEPVLEDKFLKQLLPLLAFRSNGNCRRIK